MSADNRPTERCPERRRSRPASANVDGEPACRRGSVQLLSEPGWPSISAAYLGTFPDGNGRAAHVPRLALLRVGFTEPIRSPEPLVRSYRTVSPLPVRAGARHRRSVFCGTFLRVAPTGR